MIARLVNLEVTCESLRLRSCDRFLRRTGPMTHLAIEKIHPDGVHHHVIATIELQKDGEDPMVHFIGMRPFDEDRDEFWDLAKLGCALVRGVEPGLTSPRQSDGRSEKA